MDVSMITSITQKEIILLLTKWDTKYTKFILDGIMVVRLGEH